MSWFMAAIYDRFMEGMERACGDAWRTELLADLRGDVLEIGAGTGRNLEHYRDVARLVLSEPDPHMRKKLADQTQRLEASRSGPAKRIEVTAWGAEKLACEASTFDAVVCTFVLCSVRDPMRCLGEIRRVLRPHGKLVFLEHVAAEDPKRLAWQRGVEPAWKIVAGNCHLCRDTARSIEAAGFRFDRIVRESARRALPIVRPTIRGVAMVLG
jgi:ubiquinone/menaquinone biosynthesis C-methylase UbiE